MAILHSGPVVGVVIVRMTVSRGRPHTVPPSHTCPPLSLEQSLAALEGDWLLKPLEASTPHCLFSCNPLLSICRMSPGPLRF